ncbi:MAG: CotH kinase family protein [Bacteroidetes bacterium]|nr:CotH kinase family protein [Bacteroidota bacterium]
MKKTFILLVLLLTFTGLHAQDDLYDINRIPEIRITFRDKNWKHLLDSLIFTGDGTGRILGDVTIDGKTIAGAGIRYKGYSSVNTDEMKNPFNIDLQYSQNNRNYQGYTNLKLSNVIDDPSFVREALSYEIARKYMPASHANFANLYINDTLTGLYTNVESVNRKFILDYFPSNGNAFFKGSPQHLVYPFGQNANLAYTHGTDTTGYMPYYEAESDYGWKELLDFIYILNEMPDSVESVLNTDRALWMHAFNFALLNLDSYIGYSQNYYIYKDDNGRFNPILWDMNMSFGSFRNSDGSSHFTGLTIDEEKVLDPLEHLNFCVSPRPLMVNLFRNDTYRKKYLAHIRTIIDENFKTNEYYNRGEEIQEFIDASVQQDPNKFYSYADFKHNLDSTVGGTGTMLKYPGLKDLVEARIAYLDTYPGIRGAPSITDISHQPDAPRKGEETWITATVQNAAKVVLSYREKSYDIFRNVIMFDDGNHHDGAAGDGGFGASVIPSGHVLHYYLWAENDSAGAFSPARAEYEYYSIQPLIGKADVAINEFEVLNTTIANEEGNYSSWIELCNNTREELNLKGVCLSDGMDPCKWEFPDTVISTGKYIIVWADYDTLHKGLHAGYLLNQSGGKILLSNPSGIIMDSVIFGNQVKGKSLGRYPNGYGSFVFMHPSFSAYNYYGTTPESDILLYPNPAKEIIHIEMENNTTPISLAVYDACGRQMVNEERSFDKEQVPVINEDLDVSVFPAGAYVLKVLCSDRVITRTFIKY